MEEKKLEGQRKMDKIEQEKREIERKHDEDKMGMIQEHMNDLESRE